MLHRAGSGSQPQHVRDRQRADKPLSLWTSHRNHVIFFAMPKGTPPRKSEVLQGTLDLMILKTLQALGPLHGFGIAGQRRSPRAQRGHRLHFPAPSPAARRDRDTLGHIGKQSQGEILHDHQTRPEAASPGNRRLGAHLRSNRTSPPTGGRAMIAKTPRPLLP
jgi:hypothetical protein